MKKNGFVFIESIVTIVLLTASLLLLYSSFSKIIQIEKKRQKYDDIKYVYRTNYIRKTIDLLNIKGVLSDFNNSPASYIYFGSNTQNILNYQNALRLVFLDSELETFDVKYMLLFKYASLNEIKSCNSNCIQNHDLDDDLISYIKTIDINSNNSYILIVVFENCNENKCLNNYSWVSVN